MSLLRILPVALLSMSCQVAQIIVGDKAVDDTGEPITDTAETGVSDTSPPIDTDPGTVPAPENPGPYGVDITTTQVSIGGRDVDVRLFLPKQVVAPVVIFNHAQRLDANDYGAWGSHLASHGFATFIPTWSGGWTNRTELELARDVADLTDWLVTQANTPTSALAGRIDPSKLGLAGHGTGAKQATLTGLGDARVRAVFALDPIDDQPPAFSNPSDYPSLVPELLPQLTKPYALLGSGRGDDGFLPCVAGDEGWSAHEAAAPSGTLRWLLPDAGYLDFIDGCAANPSGLTCPFCTIGEAPSDSRNAARAMAVAFFGLTLRGERGYEAFLDQPDTIFPDRSIAVAHKP